MNHYLIFYSKYKTLKNKILKKNNKLMYQS